MHSLSPADLVEEDPCAFDLHVRGEIPPEASGYLIVPSSRRHKDRRVFSRWHDSQADLLRLELFPGKPGRVRVRVLPVDPSGEGLAPESVLAAPGGPIDSGYSTQPNHGANAEGRTIWATNLLFGAPLEVDLEAWKPRRLLRYVEPREHAPRVSGTAHFAWSLDRRYAYLQQSLLTRETADAPVRAEDLRLARLDTHTGGERVWRLLPPVDDTAMETANFHSAFYFEEEGKRFVGLLRTGVVLESLSPHAVPTEHVVVPMPPSTIWVVEIDDQADALQCRLLPGIRELGAIALSHLDVDASGGNGFVLFANYKQADVGEETHGVNLYGEPAETVTEHYPGMVVEALNYGMVLRCEWRNGRASLRTFRRAYDPSRTSLGHSWLPINIQLDSSRRRLFCSFSGLRPRLLSRHIADAYPGQVFDPKSVRYIPSLLMRLDADTLQPEEDGRRSYLSYAEPIAIELISDGVKDYVCTFSPEVGLRIYTADDLSHMVCHAVSANLHHWKDSHFRPDPAHMIFVRR